MTPVTMRHILARADTRQGCLCVLCTLCVLCVLCASVESVEAHDLERTQVVLRFALDGSFVLDVLNDPIWLRDRMQSIPGPFADRVVLWVDGHEIRPASVEFLAPPPAPPGELPGLGIYRMRGQMPRTSKSLRWYYGLVIDPYPLTIHRADGRIIVEEIAGDAWSGTIDLSGQFRASVFNGTLASILLIAAAVLAPPIVWLWKNRR